MTQETERMLKPTSPTFQATIAVALISFVTLLTMSFVFKVEVVAVGQGRVVPLTRVQILQPEFDGKITAIHVKSGTEVTQGDVLIEFDQTETQAEVNRIEEEIYRLQTEANRIATLEGALIEERLSRGNLRVALIAEFEASTKQCDAFVTKQSQLLGAEIEDLLAVLAQNTAQFAAGKKSEEVTRASIDRVAAALEVQGERYAAAKDLLEKGTASRSRFLDAQDALTQLEKERDIFMRELDQKIAQRMALGAERRSTLAAQRNRLLQRRTEIEARRADLLQQLKTAKRRLEGSQLRAPVDGTIDQLEVHTIGGVASAGQEILRVVPREQAFEIEAVFTNTDIGFVEPGQKANIKFDAYPSERFGILRGTVTDVSADAIEIADNAWGYAIRIAPEDTVLVTGSLSNPIRTGMTGEVNITTEDRRIISYFFAPIIKTIESALGER